MSVMLQHRPAKSTRIKNFEEILLLRISQDKVGHDFLKEAFNQSIII